MVHCTMPVNVFYNSCAGYFFRYCHPRSQLYSFRRGTVSGSNIELLIYSNQIKYKINVKLLLVLVGKKPGLLAAGHPKTSPKAPLFIFKKPPFYPGFSSPLLRVCFVSASPLLREPFGICRHFPNMSRTCPEEDSKKLHKKGAWGRGLFWSGTSVEKIERC